MGQYEIVVGVEHRQLMLQAVIACAQRIDPTPYRRHALTDVQVQPFHKRGIDLGWCSKSGDKSYMEGHNILF